MTDEMIKKALKELLETALYNGDLQSSGTISNALDLINRLKEKLEISKTKLFKQQLKKELHRLTVEEIKAESIKEFAERLKERTISYVGVVEQQEVIDNLVKEMIGEQE